jgi:diguanylate cyclase (GGDEF)-like protein
MLVRLGGDEFGLLLDDSGHDDVRSVLLRIMSGVEWKIDEKSWPVTLSVGAVTFVKPPENLNHMVREADELMYRVKQSGKNDILYERRP